MSESRTPVGRLDLLLASLEDEVLRSETEKDLSPERLAMMRSDIEARIRGNMDRVEEREPGQGTSVAAARAWATMIRAKERLGSWTGVSPRVRMAFSGGRPNKTERIKGSDAGRGDAEPDDERR